MVFRRLNDLYSRLSGEEAALRAWLESINKNITENRFDIEIGEDVVNEVIMDLLDDVSKKIELIDRNNEFERMLEGVAKSLVAEQGDYRESESVEIIDEFDEVVESCILSDAHPEYANESDGELLVFNDVVEIEVVKLCDDSFTDDKLGIGCEIHAQMMRLHDYDLDIDPYRNYKDLRCFLNKAAYKLFAILNDSRVKDQFSLVKDTLVVDIGGAPGGFLQVLTCLGCKVYSVSLGEYKVHLGDRHIDNLETHCGYPRTRMVVADAADEAAYLSDEIFNNSMCVVRRILDFGGLVIIKHSNLFLFKDLVSIRNVFIGFRRLYVLKPAFSYMRSTEIYFVAIEYDGVSLPAIEGFEVVKRRFTEYIKFANEYLRTGVSPQPLCVRDMSLSINLSLSLPNHVYNIRFLNDEDRMLFVGLNFSVSYDKGIKVYSLEVFSDIQPAVDDIQIYVVCDANRDPSHSVSKFFSYLRSYPFGSEKLFVCYLRNNEVANTVEIKNFPFVHLLALDKPYSGVDRVIPWNEFIIRADAVFHEDYDYHYVMRRGGQYFFCYGLLKVRPKYVFTSDEKYRNFLLYYSSNLQTGESSNQMFYLSVYCCVSKYSARCIDGMQIRTVGFNAVAEFYIMLSISPEGFVRRVNNVSFEVGVNELTDEHVRDLQSKLPRGNTLTVTMDEGVEEHMIERCFSDLFPTIYVRNLGDDERSIDFVNGVVRAVSEVRSMWQARVNAVMKEFESVYTSLKETKFLGTCTLQHIGVVDTISGIWQKKPTVRCDIIPTVGYDGVEIISIKYNRVAQRFEFSHATRSRFVIVSTRVEMFNEPSLLDRTEGLDVIEVVRTIGEFVMYAGAPGSGKSTAILSGMSKGNEIDVSDICITANRDTVEDLRRRAVDRGYCDSDEYLRRKFRTFESLILNSRESCTDLWIDEAYMRPPGQVFMCALLTRARKIHMFCDFAQIPFINRDRLISMYYNDFKSFSWRTECRSHTYRCPRDVVALMNVQKYYPFIVTGSNPRVNSMQLPVYITSVVEIPQIEDAHYLTYIQDDKNILKSKGFKNVNTIHEYQGEENGNIVLVRITTKNYEVHNSAPHLLVAFTRHTVSFKYYTTVRDRMCALVEVARSSDQHRYFRPISAATVGADPNWELGFPVDYQLELERTVHYEDSSRIARSIVSLNAGADVTCLSVVPLSRVDAARGLEYGADFGPSLGKEYLQVLYDNIFPGASVDCRANDQLLNEREDVSFSECVFVLGGDARNFIREREYMVPYLRTSIQADVQETPQSVVYAFSERNGGAPDYLGDINSEYVQICVRQFELTYIRDKNLYATFKLNPINLNSYMIDGWFFTQKGEVVKQITAADLDLSVYQLQVYEFMLKRNPKPILDTTSTTKISAPQTIAFHKKLVNAVFCPIVREIKKRLLSVLGHNVQVFTDMSIAEFESRLNTFMRPAELRYMPFTKEIDFSKFDKSQWDKVLLIEIQLLLNLGFPSELVYLWLYMYYHTVLINRNVRFKALVEYQRKSGSPLTFLGNTFFSMVCIAVVFRNCREFQEMRKAFLFAGDDVFIFLEKFVKIDMLDFELTFNLEAKLLEYKYFYFCSKFLLPVDEDMWKVVPDPAKLLTKLGRHDLVSYEHVNEYRISVRDLVKQLASSNCLHVLEDAMEDRYGVLTSWEPFVATMLDLTSSMEKFFELYSDKEISIFTKLKRRLSSKMPSLDI
uniref:Putative non-structral polyprotein n=1 Tax=Allermuir Hill virus 1 TaxID=2511027 RepID=A0A411D3D9_9VIRU|nr:putative non-structral polyprotein [Allermuir Hill virus 1]